MIILTVEDFGPQFYRAVAQKLNLALQKSLRGIEQGVGAAVESAVKKSSEYRSILGGRLWHELGIVNPAGAMEAIIQQLKSDVRAELSLLTAQGNRFFGGLEIGILRGDYATLLDLPEARFISEGGFTIDWLNWLLTRGGYLINTRYRFAPGPNKASRTGSGVMAIGGTWGIPGEHAGTVNDNWLTRALSTLDEPVSLVIQKELKKAL